MTNRTGVNRFTRPIPGFNCGFKVGETLCAHTREFHKFDEIDGSSWCDECWGSDDNAMHAIAYHAFDQGVYANV